MKTFKLVLTLNYFKTILIITAVINNYQFDKLASFQRIFRFWAI